MERQIMQEFIEIYHSEPSLWKVRSSHYNNKVIKNAAYRRMVAKLRELYPNADIEMVKRKINALRTNYRKELRKVEASRERNRVTGEPVYIPSLWYFELFHFIGDQENEDVYEITDNVNEVLETQEIMRVDFDENIHQFEGEESDEFEEEFQDSNPECSKSMMNGGNLRSVEIYESPPPTKRRRNHFNQQLMRSQPSEPHDGHEMFGRYVASRLRTMDKNMQALSERLISEVLFRGQIGLLGRSTCISDDDLPIHPIKVEE